jgi:hypothetical protein
MLSSDRIRPHDRTALAVAWSIDPKDIAWPIRIRFDQDEPVPLSPIRLATDPRLEPPSERSLQLEDRVQRSLDQVKTPKYREAVADAGLAARVDEQARQEATLEDAQRTELVQRYAELAVELLRQAVAKGVRDFAHFKQDEDLDALRGRDDFKRLLQTWEK